MSTSFPASTSKDSAVGHDALRLMVLVARSLGVWHQYLRTALDAANGDETALLQALVRGEAGSGVAALTKLTGISAPVLLESWTASLVEAETGAQSVGGRRSWDTGSMWRGLATLFPTVFRTASLRVTHAEAGNWQLAGASVRGFSAAYTVLDGTASGVQRIELQPGAGQTLRLRITRMP